MSRGTVGRAYAQSFDRIAGAYDRLAALTGHGTIYPGFLLDVVGEPRRHGLVWDAPKGNQAGS